METSNRIASWVPDPGLIQFLMGENVVSQRVMKYVLKACYAVDCLELDKQRAIFQKCPTILDLALDLLRLGYTHLQ